MEANGHELQDRAINCVDPLNVPATSSFEQMHCLAFLVPAKFRYRAQLLSRDAKCCLLVFTKCMVFAGFGEVEPSIVDTTTPR